MAKAGSKSNRESGAKTSGRGKASAKSPAGARTSGRAEGASPAPTKADAGASSTAQHPEGLGEKTTLDDALLPSTSGKIGVLGGPKDRGIKPDDKLSLPAGPHFAYERVRSLDPKSFYCAMRWNYKLFNMSPEEAKRWWANKKLLVTAGSGKRVVVRAVDYGPHENTGLDISVSPGAAEALGVQVGDEVRIAFADHGAHLGPVE
jgi:hypothetical protein